VHAAQAPRIVVTYVGGNFEFFCPAGATYCTDGCKTWRINISWTVPATGASSYCQTEYSSIHHAVSMQWDRHLWSPCDMWLEGCETHVQRCRQLTAGKEVGVLCRVMHDATWVEQHLQPYRLQWSSQYPFFSVLTYTHVTCAMSQLCYCCLPRTTADELSWNFVAENTEQYFIINHSSRLLKWSRGK